MTDTAASHPFEPPIDPSGADGRRLLREELAKLPYQERKSLIDTITEWLTEQLDGVAGPGAGIASKIILLLLVAALVGLIIYAATRMTSSRRASRGVSGIADVLTEAHVSAAEYRARARAADAAGDHSAALLDWFRAIARSSDERALLGEEPAQTAHELTRDLGPFFPDEAAALRRGGDLFDDVRYGDRRAAAAQSAVMRELDERLTKARPRHDAGPTEQDPLVVPGRWAP